MKKKLFTLIEILATISIIVVLLTLISPLTRYLHKTKVLEAKVEMRRIQSAIYDFYSTYKKLPIIPASEFTTLTNAEFISLYKELAGLSTSTINTRKIKFYISSTPTTPFLDPWEVPYKIFLDTNYDYQIPTPNTFSTTNKNVFATPFSIAITIKEEAFKGPVNSRVFIYTNGVEATSNADINNWETKD